MHLPAVQTEVRLARIFEPDASDARAAMHTEVRLPRSFISSVPVKDQAISRCDQPGGERRACEADPVHVDR